MVRLVHLGFSGLFLALSALTFFAAGYFLMAVTVPVLADDGRPASDPQKPAQVNSIEARASGDSPTEADKIIPKQIVEESHPNSLRPPITNNPTSKSILLDPSNGARAPSPALEFRATAYCLKGRTASGVHTRPGVVAADPRVLPLGTVVHIEAGHYTGTYTVLDTGRRIKGRTIDIYIADYKEARRFGHRRIKVRILGQVTGKSIRSSRRLIATPVLKVVPKH